MGIKKLERELNILLISIFVVVISLISAIVISSWIDRQEEKETLRKGIEASVEILDKEIVKRYVNSGSTIVTYKDYVLKLYVYKELREKKVDKSYYDAVEIGDLIDVKLYEDRLEVVE